MTPAQFPRVPIDREEITRIRERLRQQIRDAPPASDLLTRELRENIANGVRGRDLLNVAAYRDHFAAHAEELTKHARRLRKNFDEQTKQQSERDQEI
jgi:hypothetical protein